MKRRLTSSLFCLSFMIQPAVADIDDDCRNILNDAQKVFPTWFSGNPKTQFQFGFCFRAYDSQEFDDTIYAGVYRNKDNVFKYRGVYTLGGPWKDKPYYVGQTADILNFLETQLANHNNGDSICNSEGLPDGIHYRTEGDTTYVTTDGCIKLPENRSFCEVSPETADNKPVATNIHVLSQTEVDELKISGISIPDSSLMEPSAQSSCIIHAPSELVNHKVVLDICYDITSQFENLPANSLAQLDYNPPVTMTYKGTSTSTKVNDCFKTNASSIINLVTEEIWIRQNGTFVKVN